MDVTLGEKIKNLFDVKGWVENFIGKIILTKGVKHAVSAIVGLLGSVVFATKVKPILDQLGISIDTAHLAEGLTVFFTGLAGSLMNWAIKVMHKDEQTKPA